MKLPKLSPVKKRYGLRLRANKIARDIYSFGILTEKPEVVSALLFQLSNELKDLDDFIHQLSDELTFSGPTCKHCKGNHFGIFCLEKKL